MKILFVLHLFCTFFMTGLIGFVQIVHYPLFAQVSETKFQAYEDKRLTGYEVAPIMLVLYASESKTDRFYHLKIKNPMIHGSPFIQANQIDIISLTCYPNFTQTNLQRHLNP